MADTAPVVEAAGIVKRFGATVALREAHIAVAPGESHALVGRNGAGKSTLVSILSGITRPDAGTLRFSGEPAPARGDTAAWQARVACVYQRSTILPGLTVAENLYLGRQSTKALRRIRWGALRRRAADLLAAYDVRVDPNARAGDLTVEQRQFVEIARALSFGARFIILDEPTAKLDAAGISRLFAKLRELRKQGVAFLFISHHLREVYELCQTVTVFRDAAHIVTAPVAELGHDALVERMTGEGVRAGQVPARAAPAGPRRGPGRTLLRASGLTLPGHFTGVDLDVRTGEVVGLAGATASGNVRLGETLAGLHRPAAGTVVAGNRPVRGGDVPAALRAGIALVPEDRHLQGLVPRRSVAENATLTVTGQLGPFGTVLPSRSRAFAARMIAELDIKTPDAGTPVSALSGGNQQKVMVARALATGPDVVVAVRPTNGVDVKSKEYLLNRLRSRADAGKAVLIVSDELDDLRSCDRVMVMFDGRVAGEFAAGWHDEQLVAAMEGVGATAGRGNSTRTASGPPGARTTSAAPVTPAAPAASGTPATPTTPTTKEGHAHVGEH